MIKKDGKEYYTFVGLINRMDACRNSRDPKWGIKDIPESVNFRGSTFALNKEKTAYCHEMYAETSLAKYVAKFYGDDLSKYLTMHEFIVTPKTEPGIRLTGCEKEFIRMCGMMLKGQHGIESVELSADKKVLTLYFEEGPVYLPIAETMYNELTPNKQYTLKDLKIYGEE